MAGNEEALERARAARSRSLQNLQDRFTKSWFPGGEAFTEPVIRLHDAAHQWSNISPTPRGELQQNALDLAGSLELYKRTGARGVINSFPFGVDGFDADDLNDESVEAALTGIQRTSKLADDPIYGSPAQRDLPPNDPRRLQVPAITGKELQELAKRGQEFYGKVGDELMNRNPDLEGATVDQVARRVLFSPAPGLEVEIPMNRAAALLHHEGSDLAVPGGYDAPGRMSYGPMEARLNRPLHYTVDEGMLAREAAKDFREMVKTGLASPQFVDAFPGGRDEAEAWLRRSQAPRLGLPKFVPDPESARAGAPVKDWFADHDRSIKNAAIAGTGKEVSALKVARFADTQVAEIAARARDLSKVRGAVASGFNATADLAGSVPLFDPEFRKAVERGDVRKAGKQVVEEYLAGTAAAAVMGLGTGAAARLAPQTTAAVLPVVAGVTRIANPVAVVSQLGGSAKPSRRKQSIERQQDPAAFGAQGPSANLQLINAEIARRQGGKWTIPGTKIKLPELGITETGSLSVRDTSQLLDALFPSRRHSKGSQGRRRGAARSR